MRPLPCSGIALALWISAAAIAVAQGADPAPDRTFVYKAVAGDTLHLHVFWPTGHRPSESTDAILLFHGGGWSMGTPAWTFPTARRFADWGLVGIAVQYRLSEGKVTPIEALEDACSALSWVRRYADSLGLGRSVAGHGVSAGGHLIAATATVGCRNGEPGPSALVLWSPALDVATDGWFRQKLQGRAEAAAYSPAQHVTPTTPPTSIVHGAADRTTPVAGVRRYCDALRGYGTVCDLHVYEGLGHLLTRNPADENTFDPDPRARADGIEQQRRFLNRLGFVTGH